MNRFTFLILSLLIARPSFGESHYTVGVIGDSISVGLNASRLGVNKEFSWAGGLDKKRRVMSHSLQISDIIGYQVKVYNFAESGSESANLVSQSNRLAEKKPDYVTVLIGANDLCRMKDPLEWKMEKKIIDVEKTIQSLIQSNTEVKITIVSIPDMVRLRNVGLSHGCQAKWTITGLCSPLLAKDITPAEIADFGLRRDRYNTALEGVSQRFRENVRFESSIADFQFEWDYISPIDCFHPSIKGQSKIGEITFDPDWM